MTLSVTLSVVMTAYGKKLALSFSSASTFASDPGTPSTGTDESIAGKEGIGYRLICLHKLDAALSKVAVCKLCHSSLIIFIRGVVWS